MNQKMVIGLLLVLGGSLSLEAQFNIPGIPSVNPFQPKPSTDANPLSGIVNMAKGASGVPLNDELKIGGAVAVEIIARNGGLLKDEAITHRVAIIGKSLSYYCSRPELNFRFAVLNSSHINAYSAPGGYVFITKGLYDVVPNDQQLAAVLAHEISHITKRHALQIISRGQFMKGAFDTAGSVTNASVFDDAVHATTESILTKGFDPSDEFEADKEGRKLATKVGYAHDALLTFLTQLYKTEGNNKEAFPTHPPLSHRIDRLEE